MTKFIQTFFSATLIQQTVSGCSPPKATPEAVWLESINVQEYLADGSFATVFDVSFTVKHQDGTVTEDYLDGDYVIKVPNLGQYGAADNVMEEKETYQILKERMLQEKARDSTLEGDFNKYLLQPIDLEECGMILPEDIDPEQVPVVNGRSLVPDIFTERQYHGMWPLLRFNLTHVIILKKLKGGVLASDNSDPDIFKQLNRFAQIAKGLSVLHRLGYVHCDLKSDNIGFIDQKKEEVVLFDFGRVSPNEEEYIFWNDLSYKASEFLRKAQGHPRQIYLGPADTPTATIRDEVIHLGRFFIFHLMSDRFYYSKDLFDKTTIDIEGKFIPKVEKELWKQKKSTHYPVSKHHGLEDKMFIEIIEEIKDCIRTLTNPSLTEDPSQILANTLESQPLFKRAFGYKSMEDYLSKTSGSAGPGHYAPASSTLPQAHLANRLVASTPTVTRLGLSPFFGQGQTL